MFEIKVPSQETVCPVLTQVLQRAYYIKPSLTFEVTKDNLRRPECYTDNGKTVFVNTVTVFDDGAPAGTVWHRLQQQFRGKSNVWLFGIRSQHVNKSRGIRDTVHTQSMGSAAHAVVDNCKPSHKDSSFAGSVWDCVANKVSSFEYSARAQLHRSAIPSAFVGGNSRLLGVLLSVYRGEALPSDVVSLVSDSENADKIITADIMDSIQREQCSLLGWCVHEFRDLFSVVSALGESKYKVEHFKGKDSLPSMLQDKISILAFVENNQPVRHVGFKYSHLGFIKDDDANVPGATRYFISQSPDYIR